MMKILFIVNPAAGGSDRTRMVTGAVRAVLKDKEGLFIIKTTRGPGDGRKLAVEAVRKGYTYVFACGGDGTVNEVASCLVKTPTVLGIVPLGAGNTLARTLSIPFEAEKSIGLVGRRRVKGVDAGVFCERYFFTGAGFGLDAGFVKKYKRSLFSRKTKDFLARHPGALREFLKFKEEPLSITVDNAFLKVRSINLTASNTRFYGGPALMAPDADPFDGYIDITILPAVNILKVPDLSQRLFRGKIATLKGYRHVRGKKIEIKRNHITDVHVDGEPFEWIGDIRISAVQRGLKVLVP